MKVVAVICLVMSSPATSLNHNQVIYFVRHAEAEHNVKEREAVQQAIAKGQRRKSQHERARKSALLTDESLRDAPLSLNGTLQVRESLDRLSKLTSSLDSKYEPPAVVLVSPLRRTLMTATELFLDHSNKGHSKPRFLALEALREKRTGLACDERSSPEVLKQEFPHVDFSDVERSCAAAAAANSDPSDENRVSSCVALGEDNAAVRERARTFLESTLPLVEEDFVAIVSHKGWLRELRHTLKGWVDENRVSVDFDVDEWHHTLYGNAEIRVAELEWMKPEGKLLSVVSRSVDNALSSIVGCSMAGEDEE